MKTTRNLIQELQSEGIDLDNYDVMIGFDDEYFAINGGLGLHSGHPVLFVSNALEVGEYTSDQN